MLRHVLAALALSAAFPATAQINNPVPDAAAQAQAAQAKATADAAAQAAASAAQAATNAQAAMTALAAQIPQPATSVPPTEMPGGTVGTAGTYRPADAANPRITRVAVTSTDASGAWSVTWASPLPGASPPAVVPIAVNASSRAIVCNVTTRSNTAASGSCWQAMAPAIISITIATNPLPLVGAGVSVQVTAIPTTQ